MQCIDVWCLQERPDEAKKVRKVAVKAKVNDLIASVSWRLIEMFGLPGDYFEESEGGCSRRGG